MNFLESQLLLEPNLHTRHLPLEVKVNATSDVSQLQFARAELSENVVKPITRELRDRDLHTIVLDLPWQAFGSEQINYILGCVPSECSITLVDGPKDTPEKTVRRVFPSLSSPSSSVLSADDIWGVNNVLVPRRESGWIWQPHGRWLLLSGTTNGHFFIEQITELANPNSYGFPLDWAPGPFVSSEFTTEVESTGIGLVPHAELRGAQQDASYAICRFGVSALEMMALGVPSIILPEHNVNENDEIEIVKTEGLAVVIDSWDQLAQAVVKLRNDEDFARTISSNCISFFSEFTVAHYIDE